MIIGDVLAEQRLVSPDHSREMTAKLAAGTAKEEDWRSWIEFAMPEIAPAEEEGESGSQEIRMWEGESEGESRGVGEMGSGGRSDSES